MRVIYDISYLSLMAMHASRRESGVGRVCRNMLSELLERPECAVTLASSEHICGAPIYAARRGLSDRFPGPASPAGRLFVQLMAGMHRVIYHSEPCVDVTAGGRFARRVWHRLARVPVDPLNASQLQSAEIYHASHYPLPALPLAGRHLRKVITVCDIIPLVRPEFFDSGILTFFNRVIGSIDRHTWVIAISESTKRDVCSVLGILPERVFVAPLAAESAIFYPCHDKEKRAAVRHRYNIPAGPYLLSLCTLEPRKNLASLVGAFCLMARQNPEIQLNLVLVGASGWHLELLHQALERAAELRPRIILPGYVADQDLASLYSEAHAFAYLSEYEGFGLPPLEAMQCGVPVIASNSTSLPEVVGEGGVLLNPLDEMKLAEVLGRLCRDDVWRKELGARGSQRAARFTWARCVDNVVATYQAAMQG